MTARKYSRQREAIYHFLTGRKDHPTAEAVYLNLRKKDPHLSLGTVYRNLSLLSEQGEISRISTGSGPDHFDWDISSHQHFICRCCNTVQDIQAAGLDQIIHDTEAEFPGQIDSYTMNFYGLCEACKKEALNAPVCQTTGTDRETIQ